MTDPDQLADVNHLLGVGSDRLLASGDGLYWLDLLSGRILGQFPRPTSSAPGTRVPIPAAGGAAYWPAPTYTGPLGMPFMCWSSARCGPNMAGSRSSCVKSPCGRAARREGTW